MKKEKKTPLTHKIKENPWILSTVVLAVLAIVMIATGFGSLASSESGEEIGQNFVEFINSKGGAQIEFVNAEEFSPSLYQVTVLADGNEVPAHVTKDGKYFVQVVSPLTDEVIETQNAPVESAPAQRAPAQEVATAAVPNVELFIMSHCPYGTQSMKGIIPTVRALGDTIDFNLRFVNYAMHAEKEVRQQMDMFCIREEQEDKLLDYLECFLGTDSGSEADGKACLEEVGVDVAKLDTCVEAANVEFNTDENLADKSARFPRFLVDDELNKEYGVKGSPTLVVNGAQVSSGRDSQSYLDVICTSFSDTPELCGTISVSSAGPSPGFGYGAATTAGSEAQCG